LSSAPETPTPRRGLGRGLEVLVGGAAGGNDLLHLPVDTIHPNARQPRRRFEPEAASGLAESVRRQGVIQPLLVRPRGVGGYEIVAGERRWRAAREAGRETVPAVVRTADDRDTLLLGLVENVAREQLTPIEEARAYAVLIDEFSLSLGEVAERVGRSKPSVSYRIRLLELPDDVLGMVERGQLTEGHARAVLAVPDHEGRRRLAREIVRRGLSVRAAEQRAKWAGARERPRMRSTPVDPALAERVRNAIEQLTGRHARVVPGRVELPFGETFQHLAFGFQAGARDLHQMFETCEELRFAFGQIAKARHVDGDDADGAGERIRAEESAPTPL
jgi:ParB family chromosome partitioning protein